MAHGNIDRRRRQDHGEETHEQAGEGQPQRNVVIPRPAAFERRDLRLSLPGGDASRAEMLGPHIDRAETADQPARTPRTPAPPASGDDKSNSLPTDRPPRPRPFRLPAVDRRPERKIPPVATSSRDKSRPSPPSLAPPGWRWLHLGTGKRSLRHTALGVHFDDARVADTVVQTPASPDPRSP